MLEGAAPRLVTVKQIARPALTAAVWQQLTAALLTAALLETLLLRLVTRVGVHLPKEGAVTGAFQAASFFGSLALNFASLLAIALVVLLLGSMVLALRSGVGQLAVAGLSLAMLWGLGLSLATGGPVADALFGLAVTLLVGLIGLVLVRQGEMSRAGRLALALMVAAYFCYQYYALALAGLSPVSTMAILTLWTTGLSLFLPFPVYLLSLGLYLLTLVACWRSGDTTWTGAGLLLLLLAGYMPEATYHHLLLLGVVFLSRVFQWATTFNRY